VSKQGMNEIDPEFVKRLTTAYVLLPHRREILKKMLVRLTHKVQIIEANGQSYRLEQSRKRLARQKKRAGQN
jgi:hypothetical protein